MKILVDGEVFRWQQYGGISRVFARVLPELAKEKDIESLQLVVPAGEQWHVPSALRAYQRVMPQLPGRMRPWRLWRGPVQMTNRALQRWFWARMGGDVFVSTFYTQPPRPMPSVVVVHDLVMARFPDEFEEPLRTRVLGAIRTSVARANRVICVSEHTKRDVVELLHKEARLCRVVYSAAGITPETHEAAMKPPPGRWDDTCPFLLFVGHHRSTYKGFAGVVEHFARHAAGSLAGFRLAIVSGASPAASELDAYGVGRGNDRTRFLSAVSDGELAWLYRHCAALVYPSTYEGFGIPVLEALSFGAPVVCCRASSLPEVGGDAVYYFEPGTGREYGMALAEALAAGRSTGVVALRKAHAGRFTWERTARGYADAIREAL